MWCDQGNEFCLGAEDDPKGDAPTPALEIRRDVHLVLQIRPADGFAVDCSQQIAYFERRRSEQAARSKLRDDELLDVGGRSRLGVQQRTT